LLQTIEYIISTLKTQTDYHRRKCHQFHGEKKMADTSKEGCYRAKEYATSQLHISGSKEVPACVRNIVLTRYFLAILFRLLARKNI